MELNGKSYARDGRYKLRKNGELFDLKDAPFTEIPVDRDTTEGGLVEDRVVHAERLGILPPDVLEKAARLGTKIISINPLFETGSPDYAWMNDIVCVGSGYLVDGAVAYNISQIM